MSPAVNFNFTLLNNANHFRWNLRVSGGVVSRRVYKRISPRALNSTRPRRRDDVVYMIARTSETHETWITTGWKIDVRTRRETWNNYAKKEPNDKTESGKINAENVQLFIIIVVFSLLPSFPASCVVSAAWFPLLTSIALSFVVSLAIKLTTKFQFCWFVNQNYCFSQKILNKQQRMKSRLSRWWLNTEDDEVWRCHYFGIFSERFCHFIFMTNSVKKSCVWDSDYNLNLCSKEEEKKGNTTKNKK